MKRTFSVVALVLVANGLTLLTAWRNRTEPVQEIVLSEREFFIEQESRQRSSVFLRLATSTSDRPWLTEAKLVALGFSPIRSEEDAHQLPRRGFVALELEGPEFHRLEEQRHRSGHSFRFSRLVSVDFSLHQGELEQRYPNRGRYLIVRGVLRPSYTRNRQPPAEPASVNIEVEKIFVPKQFRAEIPQNSTNANYRVWLRLGRNYEPWIVRAQAEP